MLRIDSRNERQVCRFSSATFTKEARRPSIVQLLPCDLGFLFDEAHGHLLLKSHRHFPLQGQFSLLLLSGFLFFLFSIFF